jgi:hypothetical protein
MPHFRTLYDANYLYAHDLQERDVTVTIKRWDGAKVKNKDKTERKPILFFKESKDGRGLVLCVTNGKTIARMYGNDIDDWVGKRITLFSTRVDAFGETVDAIRIRPGVPPAKVKAGEFKEAEEAPAPTHALAAGSVDSAPLGREPGDDTDE